MRFIGVILIITFCILSSPASAESSGFQLFNSTETQHTDITPFTKWTQTLKRTQFPTNPSANIELQEITHKYKGKQKLTILEGINHHINRITYKRDLTAWNKSDYWATPEEFFQKKQGDCEDFAIAKYFTLKLLGFKDKDMRIVILNNKKRGEIHAVLAVNINGQTYILDNEIPQLTLANQIQHYQPIYSINTEYWWRHQT